MAAPTPPFNLPQDHICRWQTNPYQQQKPTRARPKERRNLTNPPVFVRERPKTGGFHHISLGTRFRASKARKPYPLWEDAQGTLSRRKGFLGAASFGIFSRQRPRKVHLKPNDSAENIISTLAKQKLTSKPLSRTKPRGR